MRRVKISQLLIISDEQVVDILKESVQIGIYIHKNASARRYPLSVIELQYDMWDKYNHFILKKVFDSEQVIEEYDNVQTGMYIEDIYSEPSSIELIERIKDKILYKLDRIKLLIDKI